MAKVLYNTTNTRLLKLSEEDIKVGQLLSGDPHWGHPRLERHDPTLIKVYEIMGASFAGGSGSHFAVKEVSGPYRIVATASFELVEEAAGCGFTDPGADTNSSKHVVVSGVALHEKGFLSDAAIALGTELSGHSNWNQTIMHLWKNNRSFAEHDLLLIKVIETLGTMIASRFGSGTVRVEENLNDS